MTDVPPGAREFGEIETRDEIDLAQCPECYAAVFEDVLLDHLEWHKRLSGQQKTVDIAIAELWAEARKELRLEDVRQAVE